MTHHSTTPLLQFFPLRARNFKADLQIMVRLVLLWIVLVLVVASCGRSPEATSASSAPVAPSTNQRTFQVKGVVKSIKPAQKEIEIKHAGAPLKYQLITILLFNFQMARAKRRSVPRLERASCASPFPLPSVAPWTPCHS